MRTWEKQTQWCLANKSGILCCCPDSFIHHQMCTHRLKEQRQIRSILSVVFPQEPEELFMWIQSQIKTWNTKCSIFSSDNIRLIWWLFVSSTMLICKRWRRLHLKNCLWYPTRIFHRRYGEVQSSAKISLDLNSSLCQWERYPTVPNNPLKTPVYPDCAIFLYLIKHS